MIVDWNKGNSNRKPELGLQDFFEESYNFFSEYNMVFKGASLLNKLVSSDIYRYTKDVDLSISNKPKEDLKKICKDFFSHLSYKYDLSGILMEEDEKTKNSTEHLTMNFYKKDKLKENMTKREIRESIIYNIDFSNQIIYKPHKYNIYNASIFGSNVNKIYSDKIINISTRKIFSRNKDFVDLYALSFLTGYSINTIEIKEHMLTKTDIEMGDFYYLLNERENVLRATLNLRGVVLNSTKTPITKDVVEKIYSRVLDFVTPFLPNGNNYREAEWSSENGIWIEIPKRR